ncbi:MAG TPA: hypothetical protein VJ970_00225, partial [Flavobacteriaceae bacterium]|nr:hypothetical protein [Flavobacteriaceae bacterium]
MISSCNTENKLEVQIVETSANGNKLTEVLPVSEKDATTQITILPEQTYQTITGFGGSFTEASAYLLNNLSKTKRKEVIEAYFGDSGAKYSLTRTHINSSDFSLSNYSY